MEFDLCFFSGSERKNKSQNDCELIVFGEALPFTALLLKHLDLY